MLRSVIKFGVEYDRVWHRNMIRSMHDMKHKTKHAHINQSATSIKMGFEARSKSAN